MRLSAAWLSSFLAGLLLVACGFGESPIDHGEPATPGVSTSEARGSLTGTWAVTSGAPVGATLSLTSSDYAFTSDSIRLEGTYRRRSDNIDFAETNSAPQTQDSGAPTIDTG